MVNQKSFDAAMKAALEGPEVKKIRLDKHEFNVKPLQLVGDRTSDRLWKGQISHHLKWRDDDQVHYEFGRLDPESLTIEQITVNIDRSFMQKAGAELIDIVIEILKDKAEDKFDAVVQSLSTPSGRAQAEKRIQERAAVLLKDGSWEGEAKYLIFNIAGRRSLDEALTVAQRELRRRRRPTGSGSSTRVRDHRTTSRSTQDRSPRPSRTAERTSRTRGRVQP